MATDLAAAAAAGLAQRAAPWPAALIAPINNSRVVWGVAAMVFNLGSRWLVADITPAQQRILSHPLFKRAAVLCMFFAATRDVLLSAVLALVMVTLMEGLLNERSRFCVLPGARCSRSPAVATAPHAPLRRAVVRAVGHATDGLAPMVFNHHHRPALRA